MAPTILLRQYDHDCCCTQLVLESCNKLAGRGVSSTTNRGKYVRVDLCCNVRSPNPYQHVHVQIDGFCGCSEDSHSNDADWGMGENTCSRVGILGHSFGTNDNFMRATVGQQCDQPF